MAESPEGADWSSVEEAVPDLTRAVERCFSARRMKCLATMRRNGWPRLSETSGVLIAAGDLWLLLIPSAKSADLRADARVAVHCGSPTDEWAHSARVTGWAHAASPGRRARLYEAHPTFADREESLTMLTMAVTEVVVTGPDTSTGQIAIDWWTPDKGLQRSTRPGG